MIFAMFSAMTGWRRLLVTVLHLVMFFGLYLSMGFKLDSYLLPSQTGSPELVWWLFAVAFFETALIAWLTRTVSFVWPTLLLTMSFVFMIESFRLFSGELYPEHRTLGAWVDVGCVAIYFVLFWFVQRLAVRYKEGFRVH